jgi:hypothetical protein
MRPEEQLPPPDEAVDESATRANPPDPLEWYWHFSQRGDFQTDSEQLKVLARLQQLFDELEEFRQYRQGKINRLVTNLGAGKKPPRGVYIWGGVGRGKSLMMDAFYKVSRHRRKRRVHFHEFMREVHARLRALSGEADPLDLIAEDVSREVRLLCFDEFHVSDIADAMILGRPPRSPHREGRRLRDDVELPARRSLPARPPAHAVPSGDRDAQARARRDRARRRPSTIAGGSSTA